MGGMTLRCVVSGPPGVSVMQELRVYKSSQYRHPSSQPEDPLDWTPWTHTTHYNTKAQFRLSKQPKQDLL